MLWLCLFCSTGLPGEEEKLGFIDFQPKKLGNWDVQILNTASGASNNLDVLKQENSQRGNLYEHGREEFQASGPADSSWSHMVPVSSPGSSCVSSISGNNILDFTYNKSEHRKNLSQDQISEVRKTKDLAKDSYYFFLIFSLRLNICVVMLFKVIYISFLCSSVIAHPQLEFARKLGFSHLQVKHL